MGVFTSFFGDSPRVAIVEAFAENPDEELSVPEIERITDASRNSIYTHVEKLVEQGILVLSSERGKAKKAKYYRFNEMDPRGRALTFLEGVLALGDLQQQIRLDEGISQEMPFPYPMRPRPEFGADELETGWAATNYFETGWAATNFVEAGRAVANIVMVFESPRVGVVPVHDVGLYPSAGGTGPLEYPEFEHTKAS